MQLTLVDPERDATPRFLETCEPPDVDARLQERFLYCRKALTLSNSLDPRYVWCKVGSVVYEARLVNRELGEYKGWQLEDDEWPHSIDQFPWPE